MKPRDFALSFSHSSNKLQFQTVKYLRCKTDIPHLNINVKFYNER